ncbi:uncharacterized protein LOC141678708 [Apium graveolens]|uniref:uncharacterized protein LOC141678708 n=1 Tax=Apium graveolens TaxID=4045 RepID=UPI003D7BBD0F
MLATGIRTLFPLCKTTQEPQSSHFSQCSMKLTPTHLSFHSNKLTHFGFCVVLGNIRNGSGLFATKSPRKGASNSLEVEGFDSDDDFEEVDDEFDEDDDDFDEEESEFNEDEDMIVPMRNMKKWLENKPLGFGEGKEYDTTIEDKLAEEIEQSRIAQLANLNKLKNNPQSGNAKNQQKPRVPELVSSGIRVRLVNLPKKKNIIRDLQRSFKGFPGMINIVPVVSGNKKTREPICTGIAFIHFKSTDDANRFIQTFSRQSIAFGKIQKQIKYEMMDPSSSKTAPEKLVGSTPGPRLAYISANDLDAVSDIENSASKSKVIIHGEYGSEDNEHISAEEENIEAVEAFSMLESSEDDDNWMPNKVSPSNALSSQQLKKNSAKKKKIVVKGKQKKSPKLNIPGSAKRLKMKEKAVLTDVFSKYAKKADAAVMK